MKNPESRALCSPGQVHVQRRRCRKLSQERWEVTGEGRKAQALNESILREHVTVAEERLCP